MIVDLLIKKTINFINQFFISGLILVPNGELMGYSMGDPKPPSLNYTYIASHRTRAGSNKEPQDQTESNLNISVLEKLRLNDFDKTAINNVIPYNNTHPWGVFFTILGTVLLDFDADACQSPARAYLLDVTIPGKLQVILKHKKDTLAFLISFNTIRSISSSKSLGLVAETLVLRCFHKKKSSGLRFRDLAGHSMGPLQPSIVL